MRKAAVDSSIPVADGLPVLGSTVDVLTNPLEFFKKQSRKQGPIFRVKAGPRQLVVLNGWDAVKFYNEEGKDYFVSEDFWGKLTGYWDCPHFISAMDGPRHIEARRTFKSSMVRGRAVDQQEQLIKIVHDTIDYYSRGGKEVSVRALTRSLTNNELFLLMTGSWPDSDPGIARSISEYQRITFNTLVLGKWPKIMLHTPRYHYHRLKSLRFVRKLQKQFERHPPESGFFKAVLDLQEQFDNFTRGDRDFLFLSPFWAGLDTLGAGLSFLIRETLENQQATERVRKELDQAVAEAGGIPDAESLRKLPELFGYCMEVLRLYPVAFGNGRSAVRDFEFKGYQIKKGEEVLVFTTSTHFDPEFFPEPDKFDPSRHSPPRNEHRERYAFNPYGRGPHICLGAGMAESMMLTTVAVLLHDYDIFATNPGQHYEMIFDPSPTLSNKFKIKLCRRYNTPSVHKLTEVSAV